MTEVQLFYVNDAQRREAACAGSVDRTPEDMRPKPLWRNVCMPVVSQRRPLRRGWV